MANPVVGDRRFQGVGDVALPAQLGESLGSVSAVEGLVGHAFEPTASR